MDALTHQPRLQHPSRWFPREVVDNICARLMECEGFDPKKDLVPLMSVSAKWRQAALKAYFSRIGLQYTYNRKERVCNRNFIHRLAHTGHAKLVRQIRVSESTLFPHYISAVILSTSQGWKRRSWLVECVSALTSLKKVHIVLPDCAPFHTPIKQLMPFWREILCHLPHTATKLVLFQSFVHTNLLNGSNEEERRGQVEQPGLFESYCRRLTSLKIKTHDLEPRSEFMADFFARTPRLEAFSLHASQRGCCRDWILHGPWLRPDNLGRMHLKYLSLNIVSVHGEDLAELIAANSHSLERVRLQYLRIRDPFYFNVFEALCKCPNLNDFCLYKPRYAADFDERTKEEIRKFPNYLSHRGQGQNQVFITPVFADIHALGDLVRYLHSKRGNHLSGFSHNVYCNPSTDRLGRRIRREFIPICPAPDFYAQLAPLLDYEIEYAEPGETLVEMEIRHAEPDYVIDEVTIRMLDLWAGEELLQQVNDHADGQYQLLTDSEIIAQVDAGTYNKAHAEAQSSWRMTSGTVEWTGVPPTTPNSESDCQMRYHVPWDVLDEVEA